MVCKYCNKKLPDTATKVCPHCFAAWAPVNEPKQEDKKQAKTEESKTVLGH